MLTSLDMKIVMIKKDKSTASRGKVFPIYVSQMSNKTELNLLYITNNDKKHYVLIKDFNRFMFNKTKSQHKKWLCMSCLQHFNSEEKLKLT